MTRVLVLVLAAAIFAAIGSGVAIAAPGDTTWVHTYDHDYYNWATPHIATYQLPSLTTHWQKILLYYKLSCPPPPGDCDPWDRIAWLQVLHDTGRQDSTGAPILEPFEIARVITPYDITGGPNYPDSCSWVLDVSDYKTLLHDSVTFSSYIETWIGGNKGWLVTIDFAFIEGEPALEPFKVVNLWQNYYTVYGDPAVPIDSVLAPVSVPLDPLTVAAKLRVVTTGHGQGNTDNCAEFCAKEHDVIVDGDTFSHVLWRTDCSTNPCHPQGGTWRYPRAGWCPGSAVIPWDVDVTASVTPGGTAVLDYNIQTYENFCRPDNPDCVNGTTCPSCNYNSTGHTEPHYSIQSQLILYAAAGSAGVHGTVKPGDIPNGLGLEQNAPNPFSGGTTIRYSLAMDEDVHIIIYNPGGRVVRELAMGHQAAGSHEYYWDGLNDSGLRTVPGVYYFEVRVAGQSASRTMIRLK